MDIIMKEKLLEYLACPACRGTLRCEIIQTSADFDWKEILEGSLHCQQCQKVYPIQTGIPRLIADQQIEEKVQKTVDGFGYEWSKFNHQITDTYMSQQQNFYDFIHPVSAEFFRGKLVLDAGCGMGRFLKLGAEFESNEIIGVDLSEALEAAYKNTSRLPNAHVVQGDILKLPFKPCFEYIFSIGVLQFLPEPRRGFQELTKLLKPGGKISIWVYSEENNNGIIRILSPLRKYITSQLPHSTLYFISRILAAILLANLNIIYRPANEWKYLKKIGPRLPKNEYLYYTARLSYHEITSVIFDHLVPQLVVYLSKAELTEWFKKEQLCQIDISSRNKMSWRAHGVVSETAQASASIMS
jgi:SAM-dependent methyltransferase